MLEADPQDPLPEPSFLYRRLLTFLVLIAGHAAIWFWARRLAGSDLLTVIGWTFLFDLVVVVFYMAGASATEIIALVGNFRLRRGDKPKDPE